MIVSILYGGEFAKSVRFVKRHGVSILCRPTYQSAMGAVEPAWRKLESGPDATVWLGKYYGYNKDGFLLIDWDWQYHQPSQGAV